MSKLKSKKPTPKASSECLRCRPLIGQFVDLSCDADYRLRSLANLLECYENRDLLDDETVCEIGSIINDYLSRKTVRESVFLNRSLRYCTLPDVELKFELGKMNAYRRGALERASS